MAKIKPHDQCLFKTETEIATLLGQSVGDWQAKSVVLERNGLPRIDPLMGGRYWPAVKQFFDRCHGVSNIGVRQLDGKENVDAL